MPAKTITIVNVADQVSCRKEWLLKELLTIQLSANMPLKLLDVGAGEMPYKTEIINLGFSYFSHDFAEYKPSTSRSGLQDSSWPTEGYDLVCDITKLPTNIYDTIVLTEVLEHVPNPVAALESCIGALKQGGNLLISVPFNSRMHQAPYWFASGLSEFFFKNFENDFNYKCESITKVGDFVDYIGQEVTLCFSWMRRTQRFAIWLVHKLKQPLRSKLDQALITSGGLNLLVRIQKNSVE